jgi:hypothetical protein
MAERRRRNIEPLRRARKMQFFRDGHEIPEMAQFHGGNYELLSREKPQARTAGLRPGGQCHWHNLTAPANSRLQEFIISFVRETPIDFVI